MNKAKLYSCSNGVQRRDAKEVIEEFGHLIQWREDNRDSLLDIGCGSGDVIVDFIYPLMPIKFDRLIGADLSNEMVRFARGQHKKYHKLSFIQMNIESDLTQTLTDIELFDHITSFYCLHWVQNQKKALQNIYSLLQPGGDCLLAFLAKNPVFEIYKVLASTQKWSKYMVNLNDFISPYQNSDNPAEELDEILTETGFSYHQVSEQDKIYIYDNVDILKNAVRAINPFLNKMPIKMREEYLDDYVQVVKRLQLQVNNGFKTPYKLLIVYARK